MNYYYKRSIANVINSDSSEVDYYDMMNGLNYLVDLGIINDTGSSDQSTWSSAYIQKQIEEQASVVKALVGTDEEPVVIADLPVGSYVISGKIQSSQDNVTTIRVSKPRQYIISTMTDHRILFVIPTPLSIKYIASFSISKTI